MESHLNYKTIVNNAIRNNTHFHEISQEEKEKLKHCLYEMACDLDIRCRKHNLKLFLVGGSLLGAVRHGGFIPWDDDMDFGMSRQDYKKMIEIFDAEFGDQYMLRCPNSPYPNGNRFMQIFKKGTILKTAGAGNPLQPDCIYLDIFPYDYVPENIFARYMKGTLANTLMLIASCVMDTVYSDKSYTKILKNSTEGTWFLRCRNLIGKIFSIQRPEKWFSRVDHVIEYDRKTNLMTSATGRKHYFGEIYPSTVFFPLTQLQFSEHKFYAPGNYCVYLEGLYGMDYMTPPDKSKQESHFIITLSTGE